MAIWQLLQANITTDLQGILDLLKDPNERQGYAWIRLRIARLWPKWVKAIQKLAVKQDLTKRRKQKVINMVLHCLCMCFCLKVSCQNLACIMFYVVLKKLICLKLFVCVLSSIHIHFMEVVLFNVSLCNADAFYAVMVLLPPAPPPFPLWRRRSLCVSLSFADVAV